MHAIYIHAYECSLSLEHVHHDVDIRGFDQRAVCGAARWPRALHCCRRIFVISPLSNGSTPHRRTLPTYMSQNSSLRDQLFDIIDPNRVIC